MRGAGCTWNDITDRDFDGRRGAHQVAARSLGQVTAQAGARLDGS
jgi:4-hydroxybenzoate polyprenyltransferase